MTLYDKVAASLADGGLPISAQAVREVECQLKRERRAAAYDRAGLPIIQACVVLP